MNIQTTIEALETLCREHRITLKGEGDELVIEYKLGTITAQLRCSGINPDGVMEQEPDPEAELTEEFSEPEEGDYTTGDYSKFYQYGKLVVQADIDADDWRPAVQAHMDKEQFFPNVWCISDHGNAHLLSMDKESN
jgi:hypothetical protein